MKPDKNLIHILNKAIQILQSGDKNRAIKLLSNYCDKQIDNAEIRREIGMFLQQNNMPLKAEIFYRDALRINNNQAVVYFNLGVIYQGLNRIDQAINHYRQATEISGDYARAHANLAYLYKQTDNIEKCRQACLTAQQLSPDDPQIKHMVAALGIEEAPEIASEDYIKNLYDNYARNYDQHLSVTLKSKVPELIYEATLTAFNTTTNSSMQDIAMLDLGCGTGICGELFGKHTKEMIGVDLSDKMLAEAKKKKIYTALFTSDILEYIGKNTKKCDIIISSDVLIYFGNLYNVINGVSKILKHGGLFTFSIESLSDSKDDYSLNDSGRYKHNHRYVSQLADENNFSILSSTETILRQQNKQGVLGIIYVLKKPSIMDTHSS